MKPYYTTIALTGLMTLVFSNCCQANEHSDDHMYYQNITQSNNSRYTVDFPDYSRTHSCPSRGQSREIHSDNYFTVTVNSGNTTAIVCCQASYKYKLSSNYNISGWCKAENRSSDVSIQCTSDGSVQCNSDNYSSTSSANQTYQDLVDSAVKFRSYLTTKDKRKISAYIYAYCTDVESCTSDDGIDQSCACVSSP